jgi:hypothetical protein
LRTYKIHGKALVEQEPESRESTPNETDEDEENTAENESANEIPDVEMTESDPPTATVPKSNNSLLPKTPTFDDKTSATFLVLDGIDSFVINSSFGLIPTHSGKFGLFLRRGAPYRAQRVSSIELKFLFNFQSFRQLRVWQTNLTKHCPNF